MNYIDEKGRFVKGIVPWNKGKKCPERSGKAHHFYGKKRSKRTRKKISETLRSTYKQGYKPWNKDKTGVYSEEMLTNITNATRIAMKNPEIRRKIQRARLKQVFPKKDTKIERIIQCELKNRNINFDRHKQLLNFCQPDIVLPERKLAIFCDGDYWHANPLWMKKRGNTKLTKPQEKNIKRDASQNKLLKENGWNILRLWESDILNDAKSCVDKIESMLN